MTEPPEIRLDNTQSELTRSTAEAGKTTNTETETEEETEKRSCHPLQNPSSNDSVHYKVKVRTSNFKLTYKAGRRTNYFKYITLTASEVKVKDKTNFYSQVKFLAIDFKFTTTAAYKAYLSKLPTLTGAHKAEVHFQTKTKYYFKQVHCKTKAGYSKLTPTTRILRVTPSVISIVIAIKQITIKCTAVMASNSAGPRTIYSKEQASTTGTCRQLIVPNSRSPVKSVVSLGLTISINMYINLDSIVPLQPPPRRNPGNTPPLQSKHYTAESTPDNPIDCTSAVNTPAKANSKFTAPPSAISHTTELQDKRRVPANLSSNTLEVPAAGDNSCTDRSSSALTTTTGRDQAAPLVRFQGDDKPRKIQFFQVLKQGAGARTENPSQEVPNPTITYSCRLVNYQIKILVPFRIMQNLDTKALANRYPIIIKINLHLPYNPQKAVPQTAVFRVFRVSQQGKPLNSRTAEAQSPDPPIDPRIDYAARDEARRARRRTTEDPLEAKL